MKNVINFVLFFLHFKRKEEKTLNLKSWLGSQETPAIIMEALETTQRGVKITIGDLNYYFFFPFAKISFSQPKNQSFFQRLSNANGVDKKLYKKIANWLEKDMCLSDIKEGHKLSFLDKDFNTEKPGAPLTIAMKGGGGFQLIIILECPSNGFQTKRSLIEIVTLIKTLDKYERKHFADYALLAPFGILESSDTILKEFHDGKNSAYCILSK